MARMTGLWKRMLALLCAAMILISCSAALAEFSPRYAAFDQAGGAEARLSLKLDSLSPLSASSLGVVNEWLERTEFRLGAGATSLMEIVMDGESVFSVSQRYQQGNTLTSFGPEGTSYLTSDANGDMLSVLANDAFIVPNLFRLPDAYAGMASAFYAQLETQAEPKRVKERTSIKSASASQSYVNYLLSESQMNEVWPALLDTVLPALKAVLSDQPVLYAQAEALLRGVSFSGECRVKRFLDKEENDMGMQFTGQAEKDGDKRKVTLFGGWTEDKGGYISLSLPAVSGKNNFKANLSVQLTEKGSQRTMALEGTYARKVGGINVSGDLNGTLKNKLTDGGEAWTGKLTVSYTENKVKTAWTIQPDLAFTDEGLSGTVSLQRKTDGKASLKGSARLEVKPGSPAPAPVSGAKDLRSAPPESIRAAAAGELTLLAALLADLFSGLGENERTHLLHDLRTDAWMNGDD